jgi:hypothetical protein
LKDVKHQKQKTRVTNRQWSALPSIPSILSIYTSITGTCTLQVLVLPQFVFISCATKGFDSALRKQEGERAPKPQTKRSNGVLRKQEGERVSPPVSASPRCRSASSSPSPPCPPSSPRGQQQPLLPQLPPLVPCSQPCDRPAIIEIESIEAPRRDVDPFITVRNRRRVWLCV